MSNTVYSTDECTVTVKLHLGKQVDDKQDRSTLQPEIECSICTRYQNPCCSMDLALTLKKSQHSTCTYRQQPLQALKIETLSMERENRRQNNFCRK